MEDIFLFGFQFLTCKGIAIVFDLLSELENRQRVRQFRTNRYCTRAVDLGKEQIEEYPGLQLKKDKLIYQLIIWGKRAKFEL
jgi:hypothetical protein